MEDSVIYNTSTYFNLFFVELIVDAGVNTVVSDVHNKSKYHPPLFDSASIEVD